MAGCHVGNEKVVHFIAALVGDEEEPPAIRRPLGPALCFSAWCQRVGSFRLNVCDPDVVVAAGGRCVRDLLSVRGPHTVSDVIQCREGGGIRPRRTGNAGAHHGFRVCRNWRGDPRERRAEQNRYSHHQRGNDTDQGTCAQWRLHGKKPYPELGSATVATGLVLPSPRHRCLL